jgi:hypothetical protein
VPIEPTTWALIAQYTLQVPFVVWGRRPRLRRVSRPALGRAKLAAHALALARYVSLVVLWQLIQKSHSITQKMAPALHNSLYTYRQLEDMEVLAKGINVRFSHLGGAILLRQAVAAPNTSAVRHGTVG